MKTFIFSFIFLASLVGFSQQTTKLKVIETNNFEDKVESNRVLSIHSFPNGSTGIVRNGNSHLLFDIFDRDFNRIKNGIIPYQKKEHFYGEISFGNTIKIFTVVSPTRKERVVYCHEFGLIEGFYKKTKLFKTEVEKGRGIFSGNSKRGTSFGISPNGKHFVVSTDNIKKHSNSYTVRVYDSENLSLNYKAIYQENIENFYEPNDLSIDNNGVVYSLGKFYLDGRKQRKKGKANYNFILNKITESNLKVTNVDFNNKHINSLAISNIDDNIRLLGFYSNEKEGKTKGVLFFDVNSKNNEVINSKSFVLPETVYSDLFNESLANFKNDKELSSYYIDHVINDSLGNVYLIAEQFFITQTYVSSGVGGGYMQSIPNYNNLLVLKINTEGDLEWGRSIFKQSNKPSYNVFLKNKDLHVILNSGKNLVNKEDGRVKVSKGFFESTALYDIVFNSQGKVEYRKIQDNKGKNFYTPYFGIYKDGRFITINKNSVKKQLLILE